MPPSPKCLEAIILVYYNFLAYIHKLTFIQDLEVKFMFLVTRYKIIKHWWYFVLDKTNC
jgi:hypothetical protein